MNEREKLIEWMKEVKFTPFKDGVGLDVRVKHQLPEHAFEAIANHFLANGVIVPPCKVGDTVFMPWNYNGAEGVAILTVTHIVVDGLHSYVKTDLWSDDEEYLNTYNCGRFDFREFGEIVFLTEAEAKKALAEIYGGAEHGKEST